MSAFIDTSAFFAVLDADDANHPAAKAVWTRLLQDGTTLHTTSYVLVETYALLQNRIGMEAVRAFETEVLPVLNVVWVDKGLHRLGLHSLLTAMQRALSLVDCVSFEAMRHLSLRQVFCFDQHFADQGFSILTGCAK